MAAWKRLSLTLLALRIEEGAIVNEYRWSLEAEKVEESDPPLEGMQPCQHLHFSSVRPISDI